MENFVTKRQFKFIIYFITHLIVFVLFRIGIIESINSVENNHNQKFNTLYENDRDNYDKQLEISGIYIDEIDNLQNKFALLIIFSSIIIIIIMWRKELDLQNFTKYTFTLYSIIATISLLYNKSDINNGYINYDPNTRIEDNYYISFLIFLPYIPILIKSAIIGNVLDTTNEVIKETNRKYSESFDNLEKLKEYNLINSDEYNSKIESQLKNKIESELKYSTEYKLLVKAKNDTIIDQNEFDEKLKLLINKKYMEYKNK